MIRKLFAVTGMIVLVPFSMLQAGIVAGKADLVLGQTNFTTNASAAVSGSTMNKPFAVAVDEAHDRIFVADMSNNRVLFWNGIGSLANGKAADGAIGQSDLASARGNQGAGPAAVTLAGPCGVAVDSAGNLWVSDTYNNRVLKFSPPFATGMAAGAVIGQANFTSNAGNRDGAVAANTLHRPMGLSLDAAGNVWVADADNNRVLRFPPGGNSADVVLGQPDFASRDSHDANADSRAEVTTASTLYEPQDVFVDPSGHIWVADHLNHRFLRYGPTVTTNMAANLVLGQAEFSQNQQNRNGAPGAATIRCAFGIAADNAGNIWAADYSNHRILRYPAQAANGSAAVQVLGQANFSAGSPNRGTVPASSVTHDSAGGGSPNDNTSYHPTMIRTDSGGSLWVAEMGNNRVLKFNAMRVMGINIAHWYNIGSKDFVVTGAGFLPGSTVRLRKAGESDVPATNVKVQSDSTLTCRFRVEGIATGPWSVVISYNGFEAVLADALAITSVSIASIAPARATNDKPVGMTLAGDGFFDGIVPLLTKARENPIAATVVSVSTGQMTCQFDITDATTGFWNISLAPDSLTGGLANAFDIHFASFVARQILRTKGYTLGIENDTGQVVLEFGPNTFAQYLTLFMSVPGSMPPVDSAQFKTCDVGVAVDNDRNLQPQKEITLSFYYPDNYIGELNGKLMAVAYHEPGTSRWLQVYSQAYPSQNKVVARARHISMFRLIERIAGATLNQVLVYPNPYRPASGTVYDASDMGAGIVFNNLTPRARVTVYAMSGEQVADIVDNDGRGVIVWNTTNDKGEKVASGVYLYYITNPDDSGEKKKGRVAIIR